MTKRKFLMIPGQTEVSDEMLTKDIDMGVVGEPTSCHIVNELKMALDIYIKMMSI